MSLFTSYSPPVWDLIGLLTLTCHDDKPSGLFLEHLRCCQPARRPCPRSRHGSVYIFGHFRPHFPKMICKLIIVRPCLYLKSCSTNVLHKSINRSPLQYSLYSIEISNPSIPPLDLHSSMALTYPPTPSPQIPTLARLCICSVSNCERIPSPFK